MTTATMATPAKTKNENVSLRTFLEKNGIGGRLGNGLVMDPTHLNIIHGFNTRTAGTGEAYWELRKLRTTARLAQQYADSPLEMAPMVVGFVMVRLSFVRDTAVTVQSHWLIKFAQNGVRARLIKFVLTNSVALTVKQNFLILKETINFRSRSLLRLSPCIACTTALKSL